MLRAIVHRVPMYIDIGHIQTIKVMIGLLGFSLVLQLITFTIPGWRVHTNAASGIGDYMALMYDVRCDKDGCKTYPISEDEAKKDFLFHFVSWIIEGLVPILFTSLSLFLLIFSLRKPKWLEPSFLFCTWSLGIATVLQWDLVAMFAELHRISNLTPFRLKGYIFPVPWNVVLHSFSTFLTTTVMVTSLLILMKKLVVNAKAIDNMEEPVRTDLNEFEAEVLI